VKKTRKKLISAQTRNSTINFSNIPLQTVKLCSNIFTEISRVLNLAGYVKVRYVLFSQLLPIWQL